MTELAKDFIRAEEGSPKHLITATWDDAPHLSKATRDELYKSIPPHEREARTEGRPMLGSGAVYPVPESDIVINDFEIPDYFPRGFGMDVGWSKTASPLGRMGQRQRRCLYHRRALPWTVRARDSRRSH